MIFHKKKRLGEDFISSVIFKDKACIVDIGLTPPEVVNILLSTTTKFYVMSLTKTIHNRVF